MRHEDDDDDLMFEMEHDVDGDADADGDGRDGDGAETSIQRCKVCNTNFRCSADYKLLVRRRRGRRSRAVCDDCLDPHASHDSSDDGDETHDTHSTNANIKSSAEESSSTDLDADTLNAILMRLVAGSGTAEQLICCSSVCRTWYAGTINDELWRVLLIHRCVMYMCM